MTGPAAHGTLIELPELRDRTGVFRDRAAAGEVLAGMLAALADSDAVVFAVPAGGAAVAAVVARRLRLALDVVVTSKMTPPWNSEVGYGAVAFDGAVLVNEALVRGLGLSAADVEEGMRRASAKVAHRVRALRGDRPMPDLAGRAAILVDDGLASGFTMRCALEAVGRLGPARRVVAVPTAHEEAVRLVAACADVIYCANVRSGLRFAVADAYERWHDVGDAELAEILAGPRP